MKASDSNSLWKIGDFLHDLYMSEIESSINSYKKSGFHHARDTFSKALQILESNLNYKKSSIYNKLQNTTQLTYEVALRKIFEDILGYLSSDNYNLIQKIKTGNATATDSFYIPCYHKIKKLAYNSQLNNEEIRDIYHDSLIKLLEISREEYFYLKSDTQISTFIYSIYKNILLNKLKKHSSKLEKNLLDDPDYTIHFEVLNANPIPTQTNKQIKIQLAISKIGEACQGLLIQRFSHEKLLKDIAKELGKSEGAVKMRFKRCKAKLRRIYFSIA